MLGKSIIMEEICAGSREAQEQKHNFEGIQERNDAVQQARKENKVEPKGKRTHIKDNRLIFFKHKTQLHLGNFP